MDDQLPNARPPHDRPDDDAAPPEWTAIARHLAGEESDAEAEAARLWLAQNPGEAAAVESLDATLDRMAFQAPSDLDVEGALRRVKARRGAERSSSEAPHVLPLRRPASRRTLGLPTVAWRAAAVLAIVAGGAAVWKSAQPRRESAHRYATLVGASDSVRLADGTQIVLGPASTLDVSADYGTGSREVSLRGEAFFAVHHDAERPFVVRTATATMVDVGTAFAVRESADGRVTVAVTEGSVRLAPATAPSADAGVLVRAGDRGTIAPATPIAVDRGVVTPEDVAWTHGRLVFQDATLAEVAVELKRWYGIELRPDAPEIADRHLTAAFAGEPVDEVLRVVGLALGATVERRGDTAFVRRPAGAPPTR